MKKYPQFAAADQMWHWCVRENTDGTTQTTRTKLDPNKTAEDYKDLWKHGNIIRWYSGSTHKSALQISIRTFEGTTIYLKVDLSDLVSELKNLIHHIYGISADSQRLIFGGKELADTFTLSDYKITKDATIHLKELIKNKKGEKSKSGPTPTPPPSANAITTTTTTGVKKVNK